MNEHPAMPSRDVDLRDTALSNEHPTRAEDVLPRAYALDDAPAAGIITRGNAAEVIRRAAEDIRRRSGTVHTAVDLLGIPALTGEEMASNARLSGHAAQEMRHIKDRVRTILRAAALLTPVLLVAVGLVAGPGADGAQAATAGKTWTAAAAAPGMEGPQPDPVTAPTYRAVLSGASATVRVPLVLNGRVGSVFCGSVYGPDLTWGYARVGHACSTSPFVTVTATFAASALKYGPHNVIWLADDSIPDAETAAIVDARRASRFARGTWTPTIYGDGLTVTAPLYAYTPSVGAWTPQQASPVYIQELRAGRWVTVATLTTNRRGIATGSAILGGGLHTVRVARPAGATVAAVTGTARTFYLVPTDVPIDVI